MIIAQSCAELAERILLIVPKSLIGQWQNELLNLFGIQARENETKFFEPGVYLVGRMFEVFVHADPMVLTIVGTPASSSR